MHQIMFYHVYMFTGEQGSIKLPDFSMGFGKWVFLTRERGTYWDYMLNKQHISDVLFSCKNVYRLTVSQTWTKQIFNISTVICTYDTDIHNI